ncbi:peptidase dimerization domain-containing protein, partial [Xanthomonas citri pv. citri]
YLDQRQLEGEAVVDNGELILTVEGKAVHGMDPSLGVNAGLYLIDFLSTLNLNQAAKEFAEFSNRYLHESHFGEKMGLKFHTDVMGDVTTNVGIITYDKEKGVKFGIILRYPKGFEFETALERFKNEIKSQGFEIELGKVQQPHFVDKNDPFVQKLVTAY